MEKKVKTSRKPSAKPAPTIAAMLETPRRWWASWRVQLNTDATGAAQWVAGGGPVVAGSMLMARAYALDQMLRTLGDLPNSDMAEIAAIPLS